MNQGPTFVRRPHQTNDDLVVSYCSSCNAMVGAAASYLILKLMEDEHVCQGAKRHDPPVTQARKPKRIAARSNAAKGNSAA